MDSISIVDNYRLVPFYSDTDKFYVYVGDVVVAAITRTSEGTWRGNNDTSNSVYDSPLMAAFAGANLSDPDDWS